MRLFNSAGRKACAVPVLCIISLLLFFCTSVSGGQYPFSEQRLEEIGGFISAQPVMFGFTIIERSEWEKLMALDDGPRILKATEKYLSSEPEALSDELFLDYSRTGRRDRWEGPYESLRKRLKYFALAECLENKGRFLPALEKTISLFLSLKSWVNPAHDERLDNFYKRTFDISLESSSLAFELALIIRLFPEELSSDLEKLMRKNIFERVLDPYREMVEGRRKENCWLRGTNNWNAVCHAGVAGAALAIIPGQKERAFYIAAAEYYSRFFLSGFSKDGYCTEGVGYWNYGFGHYLILSEMVLQSTNGRLDLLSGEKIEKIVRYGFGIEIAPGLAPAFADAGFEALPERRILEFTSRRLSIPSFDFGRADHLSGALPLNLFYLFPNSAFGKMKKSGRLPLRTWFDSQGVLIVRPLETDSGRLGAALKGGNNDENHNHNDVGSFVVAVGRDPVLVDPGAEVYTARTFSSRRYESNVLNSYGHPVPVVAGGLQKTGKTAAARVVKTDFQDDTDVVVLDLSACYDVPALKKLEREFIYSRGGKGSLVVRDACEFREPENFETALITMGSVIVPAPDRLVVLGREEALECRVTSTGAGFEIRTEIIREKLPGGFFPTRIGIRLVSPVVSGTLTVEINPYAPPAQGLLKNGDFEYGSWGWKIPADGLGMIASDKFFQGTHALKITDADPARGSNVSSVLIPCREQAAYEISGRAFIVSGSGMGIYMLFYDTDGNRLNQVDAKGNTPSLGELKTKAGAWEDFAYQFAPPAGAVRMGVWLHSYNASRIEVYLDRLEINEK